MENLGEFILKKYFLILIVTLLFNSSCTSQATPDTNSIAQTAAAIVWTQAVQTMEAVPTPTLFPTATPLPQPTLTPTPLPPLVYIAKYPETCIDIAEKFDISVASIVVTNHSTLAEICNQLQPLNDGTSLLVPQPTYTLPAP